MHAEPPWSPALWEQTPAAVQDDIRALEARVTALERTVQRREATVQQMTEQLRQDARTSSRPPSSDAPQATGKRPRREPSGRRPGGQPGHEGHTRALIPGEQGDVVIPVKPACCARCQHPLHGTDPQPQRQQVRAVPPITPGVTAYPWHRWVGSACGALTRAAWPTEVPCGGFGPRVQAIAALCTGADYLSTRTPQRVMVEVFGLPMRLGSMANVEQATAQAVAEPVAAARASVQQQPAAYLDETGWREGQQRAWLGTAVTAWVTVFVVRLSRRGKVAQELLGERCWGWLVTDRWSGDTWSPAWRRQLCWAHLLRDIAAMSAREGRSQESGEALRGQAWKMVHWWHRVRDGTLAPTTFANDRGPGRRAVERLLEAGQTCGVPKTAGGCREIRKRRQALWTVVRHPEIAPTNNVAERAIRPGGLWRRGSFGTHSPEGARCVEGMMTVVATLKPQHRHGLDDLTNAGEAALHGEPAPSLLPALDQLNDLMHPAA